MDRIGRSDVGIVVGAVDDDYDVAASVVVHRW